MGKILKNQKGFGAVEALLILVILGIVGFTGYFVWHAKQNTDKSLTPTTSITPVIKKTQTTTPTSTSKASVISVKEWGIQIPMPSGDSSYTYSVEDSGSIWVTNQQLAQTLSDAAKTAGQTCGVSGVQVYRTTPSSVAKETAQTDTRKYTTSINGYVYGLMQDPISAGALDPCSNSTELANAYSAVETQLAVVWNKVTAQTN